MTDTTDTAALADSAAQPKAESKEVKNSRARRVLIVVLIILVLLLMGVSAFVISLLRPVGGAPSDSGGGMVWVRSIYGYGKIADNQLQQPYGVGIGPDGVIWVPEGIKARVMGFNPDGTFSALLHHGPAGMSPNAYGSPTAVAVAEDGRIYIADKKKNAVIISDADNNLSEQINVEKPIAVAVSDDRIVVGADAGFVILDADGNLIKLIGSKGKDDDQFDVVYGVAIAPDGTIYVTDRHNNRVSAYTTDGDRKWIREMGKPSNQANLGGNMAAEQAGGAGTMILPSGITVDGNNRPVVADPFDFELTVLDPEDGKIIAEYGTYGTTDGEFVYPSGIAYDPARDWFAVADTYNDRIQIVRLPDSGGTPVTFLRSTLAGPLRALLFPLILLLALIVAWVVSRWMKRRKQRRAEAAAAATAPIDVAVEETP